MDLLISFLIFLACMIFCLTSGVSMALALALGLLAFGVVALRRGFAPGKIVRMAIKGAGDSMVVVLVMLLIGCLTALWRQSGTIAYFTYHGIRLIPSQVFILAAFFLAAIMSYLLGTSFGTAGTMGVILMTIARANNISTIVAGGAVLSGIYFGDRASPAASSASLVANETRTDLSKNIRWLLKTSILPMLICTVVYALLSIPNQPGEMDTSLLTRFEAEFNLTFWCLVPAVLLLVLAFAGMKIKYVMMIDIVVTIILIMFTQHKPLGNILRTMILGFVPENADPAAILSGGGVVSMVQVMILLLLSSACSGIFEGTQMLASVEDALVRLAKRIGRFPAMILTSFGVSAVFCNQTIGVIMCRQCMQKNYEDTPSGRDAMMKDIENSVIVTAALVPWCIASSVPMSTLGVDARSYVFTCFLYLIPICWFFYERHARRRKKQAR